MYSDIVPLIKQSPNRLCFFVVRCRNQCLVITNVHYLFVDPILSDEVFGKAKFGRKNQIIIVKAQAYETC